MSQIESVNIFINMIFGSYWSMDLKNFSKKCEKYKKNPEEVKKYFLENGIARLIHSDTHIEFVKYLK